MVQVYKLLRTQGHEVVAVFTIPDVGGRPDPLAEVAEEDGVPVLKFKQWRKKGEIIPEVRREREKDERRKTEGERGGGGMKLPSACHYYHWQLYSCPY